jgi:phosphate transport system permease protein
MSPSRSVIRNLRDHGVAQVGFAATTLIAIAIGVCGIYLSMVGRGTGIFWVHDAERIVMTDGSVLYGVEVEYQPETESHPERIKLWVGGRGTLPQEYIWVNQPDIQTREAAADIVSIETMNQGAYYGVLAEQNQDSIRIVTSGQTPVELSRSEVNELYHSNQMGMVAKAWTYVKRLARFLSEFPREANTAGGIFPAIVGTVMLVFLMTMLVVPLGVCTAVFLSEYAGRGWIVQFVRMCINNLAGVPSIVYGIFGLGFFVYFVGGGIDSLFFAERLPNPTVGTGGLIWAAMTMALMTLPVVVVSTMEGLSAIPQAHRAAALALGATKWQTIRRIVLPQATPAIITGMVLATGRAAGEVAPLMLTGVVKVAPELVVSGEYPFVHPDRKFMHLAFHIFDLAFQSPNIEASLPTVYMTTGVLVSIVILLNAIAIYFRMRLRKRYRTGAV